MRGKTAGKYVPHAVNVFTCPVCFVKLDKAISPPLAIIAPPTNGNPAPTKSAKLFENSNVIKLFHCPYRQVE